MAGVRATPRRRRLASGSGGGRTHRFAASEVGHSNIAFAIAEALLPLKQRGIAKVHMEAGFKLSDDPPTWIQPDVSVLRMERALATHGDDFVGSPELAVEVVSP